MNMTAKSPNASKVVVIGAGIVGLMTALEIQRTGRRVVVVDPGEPGGRQAASYGNAGWIGPGAIMPTSVPGLWRQVPGFLMDRSGPLVIRWAYLPRLLPWLLRFMWAGATWKKVEDCAKARFDLSKHSPTDHKRIAAEAGVGDLIEQKGQLYVYRDKAEFLASSFAWDLRRRLGIAITEFEGPELRRLVPALSDRYQYGARIDHGCHCTDLQAYCQAIAALICKRGGEFDKERAMGLVISEGRLKAVKVGDRVIECSQAVVAAGIGSRTLAAAGGDRVPLESERGYTIVIANGAHDLPLPIMPADGKMVITPMRQGLRISGQVELASVEATPDWRRADLLLQFAPRVFRRNKADLALDQWMGHRPSTPDDLPCIGPARSCAGLFYGFGHGHSGLTQAPATAKLLAALVAGQQPYCDITPMSAQRF